MGGNPSAVSSAHPRAASTSVRLVKGTFVQAAIAATALGTVAASPAYAGAQSCNNLIQGTAGADRLIGTPASDRMLGLAGADWLAGRAGPDCLYGGPGPDRVRGGSGSDLLEGGEGADRLDGNAGADRLFGGVGRDRIYGGAGDDRVVEVGDGYRPGQTIDVGSNRIATGPGRDTINAANGRPDHVDCGAGRDRVVADRADRLKRCEQTSFLVSPFPDVSPSASGNRRRSFMVSFRSLATTDRRTEFFSIAVRGPNTCTKIVTNSVEVTFHRDRVVRYQMQPFTGNGKPARHWCPGRYRGSVEFVRILKSGCRIASDRSPDPDCTDSRRIGEFSFRVR
jgi:hypothetical protein